MSLVTPARFTESSGFLQTLEIRHALRVAATRSKEKGALHAEVVWQGETFPNRTTVSSPSPDDIAPIIVSVQNLSPGRPGTEAATHRLCTNVLDSTHRLRPLSDTIKDAYRNTNLLDNYKIFDPDLKRLHEQNKASSIFHSNLIQCEPTQQASIPDDRHQGKMRRPILPRHDFRHLIDQYKDKTWSRDIRLDRISICHLGLHKAIEDHGGGIDSDVSLFEELSVPLP